MAGPFSTARLLSYSTSWPRQTSRARAMCVHMDWREYYNKFIIKTRQRKGVFRVQISYHIRIYSVLVHVQQDRNKSDSCLNYVKVHTAKVAHVKLGETAAVYYRNTYLLAIVLTLNRPSFSAAMRTRLNRPWPRLSNLPLLCPQNSLDSLVPR